MEEYDTPRATTTWKPARDYPGLEQLMCAVLSDPSLARQLLIAPADAAQQVNEQIKLSERERDLLLSVVGATDIHDFAARLYRKTQEQQ
jgi:hypothetical protein